MAPSITEFMSYKWFSCIIYPAYLKFEAIGRQEIRSFMLLTALDGPVTLNYWFSTLYIGGYGVSG